MLCKNFGPSNLFHCVNLLGEWGTYYVSSTCFGNWAFVQLHRFSFAAEIPFLSHPLSWLVLVVTFDSLGSEAHIRKQVRALWRCTLFNRVPWVLGWFSHANPAFQLFSFPCRHRATFNNFMSARLCWNSMRSATSLRAGNTLKAS